MKNSSGNSDKAGLAKLAIDPDVLARELAAELLVDPLDDIDFKDLDSDELKVSKECESGLAWLKQGHEERLQGLRVFCEYRDSRALPLLLPLLDEPCPVERMSAVYALGRNPYPPAVDLLLHILRTDSNAYVRKATAWSLGNYSDPTVLEPLIHSLQNDVAAVRLWAAGSLAEAGSISSKNAVTASTQLLVSLLIDTEPLVRSNCIWSLGRLYEKLEPPMQAELIEACFQSLLNDEEVSVRDEAKTVLMQVNDAQIRVRVQDLIEQGLIA